MSTPGDDLTLLLCAPQTPGNRSTRPLVHARMDNEPAHTTRAWTALRVRSFPTLETVAPPWTGKLPTVGLPYQEEIETGEEYGLGLVPPRDAGWWRVGAWGKLRPSREVHGLGAIPKMLDGARAIT